MRRRPFYHLPWNKTIVDGILKMYEDGSLLYPVLSKLNVTRQQNNKANFY